MTGLILIVAFFICLAAIIVLPALPFIMAGIHSRGGKDDE